MEHQKVSMQERMKNAIRTLCRTAHVEFVSDARREVRSLGPAWLAKKPTCGYWPHVDRLHVQAQRSARILEFLTAVATNISYRMIRPKVLPLPIKGVPP
jgi:hypothetical protein